MFKKSQESRRPGRIRMDQLNSQPRLENVSALLDQANDNQGSLCELPIKYGNGEFLLSCEYASNFSAPCWTLYTGLDGARQMWTFNNHDAQMIFDMVHMSIAEKTQVTESSFTEVTAILSQELNQQQAGMASPSTSGSWPAPAQNHASTSAPSAAPAPAPAPSPAQTASSAAPAPAPAEFANNIVPPSAAPTDKAQSAPEKSKSAESAPAAAQNPYSKLAKSLEARPNLTIGEVLFLGDLPADCVDSAMRLQEMVCRSEITDKIAVEALKIAAQKGTGKVDEMLLLEMKNQGNKAAENARAALMLLRDAGLLNEADVSAAEAQAAKQNKDTGELLVKMGKLEKLTLDGAVRCADLVSSSSIRPDQAIIALHYCVRARAPIDQALDDLSIDVVKAP